ncbi:hypothetical protein AA106555_1742 [Neokomagataea thailandica NBRC 106555]|uniref:Uncharacterized protein n=1 Tax=Neokomagataea thailandica NBRC 106555 TaxID=1223520 RepID=A0ABQ0QRV6_9PROT|nr:hypothetical protein AA106555_1742 [Neokomagataea thailandica NBRC 106555]
MHKPPTRNASPAQGTFYTAPEITASDPVYQNPNTNAPRFSPDKLSDEVLPNTVVSENIGTQNNGALGVPNSLQHNRIGVISIMQNLQTIPAHEGPLCQTPKHSSQMRHISLCGMAILPERFASAPSMLIH